MEPKDRQTPPDARAQHRAYVLEHLVDGGLTIDQAAHILNLSTRHVARLLVRPAPPSAGQLRAHDLRTPSGRDLPAELEDLLDAEKSPAAESPRANLSPESAPC